MAACDTFRAAAVDQLSIWADRIGVQIVKHQTGADPAAVAYDACEAALAAKSIISSWIRPAVCTPDRPDAGTHQDPRCRRP